MKSGVLAALAIVPLAAIAQSVPDLKVFAGAGVLILTRQAFAIKGSTCIYNAEVQNKSNSNIVHLELKIEAPGASFIVRSAALVPNSSSTVFATCSGVRGPVTGKVAARYVRALVLGAEPSESDSKALYLYSETLPRLMGPFASLLISDDLKCAADYKAAVDEGGLAGRKRFQEMLLVGCGRAAANETKVRILDERGEYLLVESNEAKRTRGWIFGRFVEGR